MRGGVKWQAPTKLLLISIPATSAWAIALFLIRTASAEAPAIVLNFWQLIGMGFLGVFLFLLVPKYREGLLFRIKHQGKNFLGFSALNESLAQGSYIFGNLAVAAAPFATYIPAMSGLQSFFLLVLFLLFPLDEKRSKIKGMQILAMVLLVAGVFLIEK